jgi:hypothetical protein
MDVVRGCRRAVGHLFGPFLKVSNEVQRKFSLFSLSADTTFLAPVFVQNSKQKSPGDESLLLKANVANLNKRGGKQRGEAVHYLGSV